MFDSRYIGSGGYKERWQLGDETRSSGVRRHTVQVSIAYQFYLCSVDSARTAVGRSMTTPARQSGTRCLMNLEILTVLIVLNGSW